MDIVLVGKVLFAGCAVLALVVIGVAGFSLWAARRIPGDYR
jgi:hypothetical protein